MNNIDSLTNIWPEWRIIEHIGSGSYGKVYKAVRDEYSTPSYSAIKVITIPDNTSEILELKSEGLDEKALKEYYRQKIKSYISEIELMETFKETINVVNIEDYKVIEKKDSIGFDIYIRMELLTSFNEYIKKVTLSKNEIIKLGIDICTALELFEQNNIIHRDIKPENLFVSDYGEFKVGDLGVARKLDPEVANLSAKGTYSYMAPEVVNGKLYNIRADIYSLGIVLYKLFNNNRLPFTNTDSDEIDMGERKSINLRRLKGEKMPNPINADEDMASVILHACEYNPDKRFQTPTEFKNALIAAGNGEKVIFDKQRVSKITLKVIIGIILIFILSIFSSILIWGKLGKNTFIAQKDDYSDSEVNSVVDTEITEEDTTINKESDTSKEDITMGTEQDTLESDTTMEAESETQSETQSETEIKTEQPDTAPVETMAPTEKQTEAEYEGFIVPKGCTYSAGGTIYTEGMKVDTPPTYNHVLTTKDYTYSYGELPRDEWYEAKRFGWSVKVNNQEQTEYEELLGSIGGEPLLWMPFTYDGCINMKKAPKIPDGVEDMVYTFKDCDSLEIAPVIPEGVKVMSYTFIDCDLLKIVPVIPNGVEEMLYTFDGCNNLETVSEILGSVKYWTYTFNNCTKLSNIPDIPQGAYSLEGTFFGCTSLKTAPAIPEGVENMYGTFSGCVSLEKASKIPASAKNMEFTFNHCISLKETPMISYGVTNLNRTFFECEGLIKVTNIPDSVEEMVYTFHNCISLTEVPDVSANIRNMEGTFFACKSLRKTPYIPEGVKILDHTFDNCDNLVRITNIPDSVTDMVYAFAFCSNLEYVPELPCNITNLEGTFIGCEKLSQAPEIPKHVTNLKNTFERCMSLSETPEIPDTVINMENTFAWCGNLKTVQVIPASVTNMKGTFLSCSSLTGEIVINANPVVYKECFSDVSFKHQQLTLTGTSTMLEELRNTNDN